MSKRKAAVLIKDPRKRRKCPICEQNICLYYINFEEMFLMCENTFCEFPFGYEPLQVVRDESQLHEKPVKVSKNFFEYPVIGADGVPSLSLPLGSDTGTSVGTISSLSCSLSYLSDSDRYSIMGESDEISLDKAETLAARLNREDRKRKRKLQSDKELQNNLKSIKKLTEEMRNLMNEERCLEGRVIRNKKWLKNLKTWEGETGTKLLRDAEKKGLGNESELSVGELNISIDPTGTVGNTPAVNIQISMKKNDCQ